MAGTRAENRHEQILLADKLGAVAPLLNGVGIPLAIYENDMAAALLVIAWAKAAANFCPLTVTFQPRRFPYSATNSRVRITPA